MANFQDEDMVEFTWGTRSLGLEDSESDSETDAENLPKPKKKTKAKPTSAEKLLKLETAKKIILQAFTKEDCEGSAAMRAYWDQITTKVTTVTS